MYLGRVGVGAGPLAGDHEVRPTGTQRPPRQQVVQVCMGMSVCV